MKASYNKLFKLLIDKKIMKGELCKRANVSTTSLGKLVKGQNVMVDILLRICDALDCTMDDIMELVKDSPKDDATIK